MDRTPNGLRDIMTPLNKAQLSALGDIINNFIENYGEALNESDLAKLELIRASVADHQFNGIEVKMVLVIANCEVCTNLKGRAAVSMRAALDRLIQHYGRYVINVDVLHDAITHLRSWDGNLVSSQEYASRYTVNERFEFIETLSAMVANRAASALVVTGSGGLGKSYTVMKALNAAMADMVDEPIVTKGYSSARALFDSLGAYPSSIHVFDDCDAILKDPNAVNLLKAAVDTGNRTVSWNTFNGDAQPFEFTGAIIFISNKMLEDVPQPILSRSLFVDVTMTTAEKIERIEAILDDIPCDLDHDGRVEVLDLIKDLGEAVTDLNVRTFIKVAAIRGYGSPRWKDIATYQLTTCLTGTR